MLVTKVDSVKKEKLVVKKLVGSVKKVKLVVKTLILEILVEMKLLEMKVGSESLLELKGIIFLLKTRE
jgi:hypothetical protein